MTAAASPRNVLRGWTPILGAFSIWFAHFLVVYVAALIWPHQRTAIIVAVVATAAALGALTWLFLELRAAAPASGQTRFARRFGLGAVFIGGAATVFDAAPIFFN